jgi:hypothetical protein
MARRRAIVIWSKVRLGPQNVIAVELTLGMFSAAVVCHNSTLDIIRYGVRILENCHVGQGTCSGMDS